MTSSEQPSQDQQPEHAGSGGWCAGGPCFQHGRTFSGLAGCGGAAEKWGRVISWVEWYNMALETFLYNTGCCMIEYSCFVRV